MEKFEMHLRQGNMADNTIAAYKYAVNDFNGRYKELNKKNLLLYKTYLIENFKPKTVNLRIQALNKYLDYLGKPRLRLKSVKVQQKSFLENVISNADYIFLKNKLKEDRLTEWYFVVPLIEAYSKQQESIDAINDSIKDRLKKSILQEAIQGRLVPQIAEEGTAENLLEEIRKEKQKLLKEGKLKKKDITDSVIFKGDDNKYYERINGNLLDISDEVPFDLPETWAWCRFLTIVNYRIGKTPARGETAYWHPASIPWVSISDMKEYGLVQNTKERISNEASKVFGVIVPKGTLLMSFKLTVGRTAILDINAFHNEAIISIFPYTAPEVMKHYLFYTLPLLANMGDSKDAIKGKTLNTNSINNLLIPVPPVATQKAIINKIHEAFSIL